jgi:predicted RNA binding protein YcfA (HicA-like mRNA interferase family)
LTSLRLPPLKAHDVIRVLRRVGFVEVRQRGGHKIFKRGNVRVVVPVHAGDLKRGTVRHIIEQAGLTVEEFLKLLKD